MSLGVGKAGDCLVGEGLSHVHEAVGLILNTIKERRNLIAIFKDKWSKIDTKHSPE